MLQDSPTELCFEFITLLRSQCRIISEGAASCPLPSMPMDAKVKRLYLYSNSSVFQIQLTLSFVLTCKLTRRLMTIVGRATFHHRMRQRSPRLHIPQPNALVQQIFISISLSLQDAAYSMLKKCQFQFSQVRSIKLTSSS